MFESFFTSLGSKLFMTLLLTSTILTTGVALSKVSSSITSENLPVKGINIVAAENIESSVESKPTQKPVLAKIVTSIPTVVKSFLPAPTIVAKPSTVPSVGCIVTLSGQQYDVSALRSTHSGGDIFICGTDMTSIYNNKHGNDFSRMQKYLITGGTTVSPIPTVKINMNKDDREDDEHEDRYIERKHREKEDDEDHDDD